jgi:hypothetical protein
MKVLEINDINRKENFIYYRREFTGTAQYDLPGRKYAGRIEFTIETAPTGKKDIRINLVDSVDYPVLPVLQTLKEYILGLDREGMLP